MVGELQVILGQHPVAVERRVVRELLVFLEHLRSVAARPAVDPVALVPALAAAIAASATPAILITILVQRTFASLLMTDLSVAWPLRRRQSHLLRERRVIPHLRGCLASIADPQANDGVKDPVPAFASPPLA